MYTIIIWHLYTQQSDHHQRPSYHLSLCNWSCICFCSLVRCVKPLDTGSISGLRRSHMLGKELSPCTATVELMLSTPGIATIEPTLHNCWSPCPKSPCSAIREATMMRSPSTATSPCASQRSKRRAGAAKINKYKIIFKKRCLEPFVTPQLIKIWCGVKEMDPLLTPHP